MKSRVFFLFCVLLLVGALLRIGFFCVSVTHIPPSFDESIAMLGAKAILQNGNTVAMEAKQSPQMVLGRFPLLMLAQPYLFPLEAYIKAPFVPFLPHNAFGARIIAFLMGVSCTLLTLWVVIKQYGFRGGWPGWLLVLFPSCYLLTLQVAYCLPGYPGMFLCAGLLIFLAFLHRERECIDGKTLVLAGGAGLVGGLACSVSLMSVPLLLAFGVMVGCGRRWKHMISSAPCYAVGAAIGFIPYFLAKLIYPGAHAAVSNRYTLDVALKRLMSPAIDYTLPCAMGIRPVVFPDGDTVSWFSGSARYVGYMFLILLVVAIGFCAWHFVRRVRSEKTVSIALTDVMTMICCMAIFLFLVSKRSHSGTYRYLLLVAWAFPVLVAGLAAQGSCWFRRILAGVSLLLTAFSLAGTVFLMTLWSEPGFAARELYFFDLDPAITQLDSLGIDRCYATALFSYRINYETNERILCSQPYNERFPGWPYPYRDVVNASTNVAYVLAPGYRYLPHFFEAELSRMSVTYSKTHAGPFSVYWDFSQTLPPSGTRILADSIESSGSHFPEAQNALSDGSYVHRWRSHHAQERGMFVELDFGDTVDLTQLVMYYNGYAHDRARSLDVLVHRNGIWIPVMESIPAGLDAFEFVNKHPYYGNTLQTIRFDEIVSTERLRIAIHDPEPGRDWTIGEVCAYRRDCETGVE